MRTLAITQNTTVDGAVEMLGDWFAPQGQSDDAGLVDEYRLFTYPAVQGRGRRLFPDGAAADRLRLVECRALRNGVTYSRHTRA